MKSALREFWMGRTTMAQSQEKTDPRDPVLVACVEPPFKPSFFNNHSVDFHSYFWVINTPEYAGLREDLEKNSSMKAVYMNMAYVLGRDLNISIFKPRDLNQKTL